VGLAVATLGIGPLVVRRPSQRGLALALVLAALASAWLMTAWAAPFWQAMPRLTQLQFPWRLAGGLTLAVAVLAGLAVSQLPARLRPLAALVCIVLAVVPAVLLVQPPMRAFDASATTWPDQVRRELVGGFGTTGNALFLPRWVRTGALSTVTEGASGLSATSLTAQVVSLDQESMTLRYQAAAPTLLTVGQVYVPVWMATVDGTRVPVQPEAQNGLQQVLLPAGAHELRLWLGQTTLGHIAAGVSLLALLAVVWLVVGGRVDPSPAPKGHPSLLPGRGVRFPAVVGALVVVLGVAAGLAWRQQQAAGGWQAPQAPSASPLQVASWRLEPLPVWGSAPVVDVVWLSGGPVTADDDVVVRLQQGAVTAERQQRPRLGALGENSWAADVLVSDHVQLPVVANVCGGNYALSLGVTMHGSGVPAVFQDLGIVSLPERPGCQPLAATVSSGPVASFQVTQLTPAAAPGVLTSLVPGTAITLSADVQKLRFTSSDAVFDARLIDSKGAVAAERLSSPNLDLWLTSLWRPGEHRPVQLTLLLPASMQVGVYHLTLGLHVPGSGRFEPVQLAGGPVVNGLAELATYVVPPPRVVPPSTAPVLASFGGDIGLESVTLQGATAGTWKAGAPLLVDLRWRCLVATHTEYTLTVQVLDASGKLVAQADAPPLDGRFPTSVWAVGDVVSETHTVPLPATLPAGTYRLMLAWYASSGGARLPVRPVAPDQMFGAGTITVSQ
jgi:hypothetical protein